MNVSPRKWAKPLAHTVSERGRLHGLMLVEGATQAPVICMEDYMGETFSEMPGLISRLNESPSARNMMEAYPRTIQFDLDGEDSKFFITIEEGRMAISQGVSEKADVIIAGDTREFAKVVRGKLDVTHTIAHGHITITKGKVSEMTLLNRILWATERR